MSGAAVVVALLFTSLSLLPALARSDLPLREPRVHARIEDGKAYLANSNIERVWTLDPFGTEFIRDDRTDMTLGPSDDFAIDIVPGLQLTGADFTVQDAVADQGDGRASVTFTLTSPAELLSVTRTVTVWPDSSGFEVRNKIEGLGVTTGYSPELLAVENGSTEIHSFRAGYDWRGSDNLDWEPQLDPLGGANSGDHRVTVYSEPGEPVESPGQWMSVDPDGRGRAFMVLERVNYQSSRMSYDGSLASADVDLSHDVVYLGPFESDIHVSNPQGGLSRFRMIAPDHPVVMEPVFTGLALGPDDEPWQYHRYLDRRPSNWPRTVTFNSNGVDEDRISTGAKDDMDLSEVTRQAAVAKKLGVETFILDDGWQSASGDWCPDSPDCPEPRAMFPDRFPDSTFAAVKNVLGKMKLGLWMAPMHFNPASDAYTSNPQWACHPLGDGLALYNAATPNDGSNEAGIGEWNPEAGGPDGKLIDHIESRLRTAIDEWGVRYFKFDFLAWLDCVGDTTVTMYDYRESFIAMLDRLVADHPYVTFQIDETNDYRMFPFESIARGPSWYANGGPTVAEALHNMWILAPYVPAYTIGQAVMGNSEEREKLDPNYLMAAALPSHMTFFTDLTQFTPEQVRVAAKWTKVYKRYRPYFTGTTYPLLDDPITGDNWTALQPWNNRTQKGSLLVFRQNSPIERMFVRMRGVRTGSYRITDLSTGTTTLTYMHGLNRGLLVSLPNRYSAGVFKIERLALGELL